MRPGVPRRADCDLRGAKAFSVEERHGLAWVNMSPAAVAEDIPTNRWSGNPSFAVFVWTSTVRAAFVDAIENLLDATHTPFVHSGLVRGEANAQQLRRRFDFVTAQLKAEYFDEGKQAAGCPGSSRKIE